MRHLRLLASLLLFVALPAFLALRGFDLYTDFVTRGHHDEAFAHQGRLLRELKDEVNLELDKKRVAASVLRELSGLPVLDDVSVSAVRQAYEVAFPGLLKIVVFRRDAAGAGRPPKLVPIEAKRLKKLTLYQAFCENLYSRQATQEAELRASEGRIAEALLLDGENIRSLGASLQKLVERGIVGSRITLDLLVEQRGHVYEVLSDGRECGLYWDLLLRPGEGEGPGGRRGVALVFIDLARYREIFDLARLTARKERDANDRAVRFEFHRLTDEAGLAPHVAAEPALAGRLRPTLGTALEAEGAERLVTWQPVRESDGLFVVASTEKAALVGGLQSLRGLLRILVILACLAATVAGTLIHRGTLRPYVSVRVQLAGLFGLASLLPLSVIFYMGLHYVRASEEVAAKRTLEELRNRVLSVDEEERRIRSDLQAGAVALLTGGECASLAAELRETGGSGTGQVPPALAEAIARFTAAVELRMGHDRIFAYYLFDRSSEIVAASRLDHEEAITRVAGKITFAQKKSFKEQERFLAGFSNALIARLSGEGEGIVGGGFEGDTMMQFFLHSQSGLADRIFKYRRVVHSFDLFGNRVDLFLEPVADDAGAIWGSVVFIYVAPFIHYHRIRRAVADSASSPDGVRLYAGHMHARNNRHPSAEAFTGDLLAAFEKVAADRNPVETRTRVNGEEALLAAYPLTLFRDYVLLATSPYAKVRGQVAQTLRLISTLLGLSVLIAAAIGLVIAVKFIRPVRAFERGVAALTEGELDYRMTVDSNDELGELSGAFNRMIAGLQEKERMSRYVSESVRGAVKRESGEEAGIGKERKATILFADIRGFTSLSETHPPADIVSMLNEYLEAMTSVVIRCDGVVDKFIGDAIMCVFYPDPAPGARPDEARAVSCALQMREALAAFNADRATSGLFTIEIGIGINTGEVIQGSIGSREHRVDLTVIGDHVNLAARLESLSKEGRHSKIVISERTYAGVRDLVEVAPLGVREVRGKEKTVTLFEIVGPKRAADYLPALSDPEPAVRVEAIRLLAVLGDATATPEILRLLEDPDARVRREATVALRRVGVGDVRASAAARAALARETEEASRATLVALIGEIGSDEDRHALEPLLTDPSARIRANAIEALCRSGDRVRLRALFRGFLRDPNNRIRGNACVTLFALGDASAIDELVAMTRESEPLMRASGAWGLGEIATRERIAAMRAASGKTGEEIPEALFVALDGALDALHDLLSDGNPMVARNAARALGRVGNRRSSVALIRAFNDCRDDEVRGAILLALEAIGGANLIGKFTA